MADNNNSQSNDSSGEGDESAYQPKVRSKDDKEDSDEKREPEGDEATSGGEYESKKEPGSRVRVAKARDQEVPGSSQEDVEQKERQGPRRRAVDVSELQRNEDEQKEDEQDEQKQAQDQHGDESEKADEEPDARAEKIDETASERRETVRETPAVKSTEDQASGTEESPKQQSTQSAESTDEPITKSPDPDQMPGMDEMGAGVGEDVDATTEDFEALLDQQGDASIPQRREYSSGDRIEGEVLEIGEHNIFVQLDPQTEGIGRRRDIENEEGELTVDVGESAEFYVTEVTDDEVYLGLQLEGDQGSMDAIRDAHDSGVPVEGKVTGTNKGGFDVEIHGVNAFCPISGIELGFTEDKDVHVGARYRFKVKEVRDGVVVNRSELLEEERREKARQTLESLDEGDEIEGVVTRLEGFGAFVDIGGVEGLIHRTELSHRHFDHPSDVLSEGDEVTVEVLEIGEEERDDGTTKPRISLSRKSTENDPWDTINDEFAVGETIEGEVTRNAPFGAFVEVADGIEGLVHVSEMSWTDHVRTPDEIVEPGDKVTVQVQDIDVPRRRISLSIKAAQGHPWEEAGDRYAEGMEVTGEVENIEDFGVFVKLPDGITALIPRSEMNLPEGVTPHRKYNEGEEVTARVLNVDPEERKMALTDKSSNQSDEAEVTGGDETDQVATGDDVAQRDEGKPNPADRDEEGGFGTLGDMIGDQLEDRE